MSMEVAPPDTIAFHDTHTTSDVVKRNGKTVNEKHVNRDNQLPESTRAQYSQRNQRRQQRESIRPQAQRQYRSTQARSEYNSRQNRNSHDNYSGCFNCGLKNHNRETCHFNKRVRCNACGHLGHKERYCPKV